MKGKSNKLISLLIGNTLEYYDFILYSVFSPLIAKYFFPQEYGVSLMLITYILAFLVRPIGAIIFGFIGDVYGRKKAFGLPLIFMSLFTLPIALIPSYSDIGIISSILLILSRIGQGFCMSGEFGGAIVLFLESNKKLARGVSSSIIGSTVLVGSLIAYIVSFIFTFSIFPHSFWRIPFIIGAVIGIIGIWIRYKIDESPEFVSSNVNKIPILDLLKYYRLPVIKSIAASGLSGLLGVFIFMYINFFLVNNLNWKLNESLIIMIFGHIIALVMCLAISRLSQRYSTLNIILLISLLFLVSIIPCLYLINTNKLPLIILAIFCLTILMGACTGSINLLLFNSFPVSVRYTGVAFCDSVGKIIFAAPIPFICNYLNHSKDSYMKPAIAISFEVMIIFLILYLSNKFDQTKSPIFSSKLTINR